MLMQAARWSYLAIRPERGRMPREGVSIVAWTVVIVVAISSYQNPAHAHDLRASALARATALGKPVPTSGTITVEAGQSTVWDYSDEPSVVRVEHVSVSNPRLAKVEPLGSVPQKWILINGLAPGRATLTVVLQVGAGSDATEVVKQYTVRVRPRVYDQCSVTYPVCAPRRCMRRYR